jgi:hypothetical protein
MANAPNTGTTLTDNGVNKTSVALSTNIIVMVHNTVVGAIKSLTINEKRGIQMIDEVGTDGHVDSAPKSSTDISGSCTRVRLDRLRIAEAFGRGYTHVSAQVYPFNIVILDKQKRERDNQITTVIQNVWMNGIDYTYSSDDWIISDTMTWQAERIYSFLNGGRPVAVGGELGIKHMGGLSSNPNGSPSIVSGDGITNIEQLVDTGNAGRGGSMDAAGLIDIGSSGDLY